MTIERCTEHDVRLPCGGCRADRLASGIERLTTQDKTPMRPADVRDVRQLAAGDD